jgi:hypothetical protein
LCSGFGDVGYGFVVFATGQKYEKFIKNKNQEFSLLLFDTTNTARNFKSYLLNTKYKTSNHVIEYLSVLKLRSDVDLQKNTDTKLAQTQKFDEKQKHQRITNTINFYASVFKQLGNVLTVVAMF